MGHWIVKFSSKTHKKGWSAAAIRLSAWTHNGLLDPLELFVFRSTWSGMGAEEVQPAAAAAAAAAGASNAAILGPSVMSFRLACSCSEGRALVMSSGKVDTVRCHPLCPPPHPHPPLPERSRQHWKAKRTKKPRCLRWHVCGGVLASDPSINTISAPRCGLEAHWSKPSRVGNFLPPRVYAPGTPCQQPSGRIGPGQRRLDACFYGCHMKAGIQELFWGSTGATWAAEPRLDIRILLCLSLVQNEYLPQGRQYRLHLDLPVDPQWHPSIGQTHAWIFYRLPCLFGRTKEVQKNIWMRTFREMQRNVPVSWHFLRLLSESPDLLYLSKHTAEVLEVIFTAALLALWLGGYAGKSYFH